MHVYQNPYLRMGPVTWPEGGDPLSILKCSYISEYMYNTFQF